MASFGWLLKASKGCDRGRFYAQIAGCDSNSAESTGFLAVFAGAFGGIRGFQPYVPPADSTLDNWTDLSLLQARTGVFTQSQINPYVQPSIPFPFPLC
ncbi:hypothetical protein MA16_Dca026070 [Dendrobium catenatum]|uniref:Uncharacterized protein n=1 Tax=Dendrobium catenatum TaxID=906689 RepID=A0A2I0VGY4_9ASPA|nr:hypothetical protein MA16_Dca026070 [Dendrobium catenatum]